jgi:hypothetical protein
VGQIGLRHDRLEPLQGGTHLAGSNRRSLADGIERTRQGIVDDTVVTVRPSLEKLEARRVKAEAFLAQQQATPRTDVPPRRGIPRRRTSA